MTDNSLFVPGLLTCALLLGLLAAGGALVIAPMLADAPGAAERRGVRVAFLALVSLPVTVLIALAAVWGCYFLGLSQTAMCAISLLPLLNVVVAGAAYGRDMPAKQ